uniref:Uncharacterized protein n=1 Tax=Globodera rostochiensis TaxID=31243 RepID=A0A914HRM6_GLORO
MPLFATNSLDKAESVQLKEKPLNPIDEIFGEGWWDNDKDEEWQKLTLEQNALHQIDRQNTQIGQIEPNSTDQNPPLTESDHSDNAKNYEEISSNENIAEDERKQKFDQKKAELTRDGFKNSYNHQIDETVANELGTTYRTIYSWKRKLGQTEPNHKYSQSKQKKLLKRYYEIKDQNPKISDGEIAKMLKVERTTMVKWKRPFKRQQFHPNSVDGHSVEANAAANVQEIGNSNLGSN